jgi:presequence protease
MLSRVGERHRGFVVTQVEQIDELGCSLVELHHEASGARVIHLGAADPENAFCISFQTLPENSNGVAHILEHTVLCGSERFPVKDPFFMMLRRSMATFMNAFTGADFTCYPASSQISKDFYNLLDVYLDATFAPRIDRLSFLQEGWRFELSNPKRLKSKLQLTGIVFNEMKGAMADPDARMWHAMAERMYPDLTYRWVSGGDPLAIPSLSYEELVQFHRTYYHPGRAIFWFYGDMPIEKHLDYLHERILSKATKPAGTIEIGVQKPLEKPVRASAPYPVAPDDKEALCQVALGWLTSPILDQEAVLTWSLLDEVLMGTDAAPLKAALLASKLCRNAESMLDTEMSQIPWLLVCRGCDRKAAPKLESLIRKTLRQIAKEGIDPAAIEAALHQLEFGRREIGGNKMPFGLVLFMRGGLLRQHGGRTADALRIDQLFEPLRQKLKDKRYLSRWIRERLLGNSHCIRLNMTPDPKLSAKEQRQEKALIRSWEKKLTLDDRRKLVEEAEALAKLQAQQAHADADVLPKLPLSDVPRATRDYPLSQRRLGELTCYHHDCWTNGIIYADLVFDLPQLDPELLPYARIFSDLITEVACAGRSYEQQLEMIQTHLGSFEAYVNIYTDVADPTRCRPAFGISGRCLKRNADKLFTLMADLVKSVDLTDERRLQELILQEYTDLEQSLPQDGLHYATHLAASRLSGPGQLAQLWNGLDYYWLIRDLAKEWSARKL